MKALPQSHKKQVTACSASSSWSLLAKCFFSTWWANFLIERTRHTLIAHTSTTPGYVRGYACYEWAGSHGWFPFPFHPSQNSPDWDKWPNANWQWPKQASSGCMAGDVGKKFRSQQQNQNQRVGFQEEPTTNGRGILMSMMMKMVLRRITSLQKSNDSRFWYCTTIDHYSPVSTSSSHCWTTTDHYQRIVDDK